MTKHINYKRDDEFAQRTTPGLTSSDPGAGAVWDEVFFNESASTINAGEFVTVDLGAVNTHGEGRSVKTSDAADQACVGVALHDALDDEWVTVRRRGRVSATELPGLSFSAGGLAQSTTGTAGAVHDALNTDINIVGVANGTDILDVRC